MGTTINGITLPLGRPCLFRLMACVDPVMVDAGYDRGHFILRLVELLQVFHIIAILDCKFMGTAINGITPPLGRPRPFRSMGLVNPVMVNAAYDRPHFYFAAG